MKNVLKIAIVCFSLNTEIFCMEVENKKESNVLTPEGMHELLNKDFRHPRKIIDEYLDYNCENDPEYQVFKDELVKEIVSSCKVEKITDEPIEGLCPDPINKSIVVFVTNDKQFDIKKISLKDKKTEKMLTLEKRTDCFSYAPVKQLLCYALPFDQSEKKPNIILWDSCKKEKIGSLLEPAGVASMCFNPEETMFFFLNDTYHNLIGWDIVSQNAHEYYYKKDCAVTVLYSNLFDQVIIQHSHPCCKLWDWRSSFGYAQKEDIPKDKANFKYYMVGSHLELTKVELNNYNPPIKTESTVAGVHYDEESDQFFTIDMGNKLKIWNGKTEQVQNSYDLEGVPFYLDYDKENKKVLCGGPEGVYYLDLEVPKKLEKPNLSLQQYYALLGLAKNRAAENPLDIFEDEKQLDKIFQGYPEIINAIRMCAQKLPSTHQPTT